MVHHQTHQIVQGSDHWRNGGNRRDNELNSLYLQVFFSEMHSNNETPTVPCRRLALNPRATVREE